MTVSQRFAHPELGITETRKPEVSHSMTGALGRGPAGGARRHLGAVQAGRRFCGLLSGSRRYRIHSVFARALNLWDEDGREFLTLLPLSRGCGATYATLALAPEESFLDFELVPGLEAEARDGTRVQLGLEVVVDFSSALTWESRLSTMAPGQLSEANLLVLRRALLETSTASPFRGAVDGSDSGLAALLDALRAAVLAADGTRLGAALASLVGFGPGLTPSGDDVVVGMSLARAVFRRARRAGGRRDGGGLWEAGVRGALARTHALSAFLIEEALAGRSHEFVEDALGCLLAGGPQETGLAAGRLIGVGATSGFDIGVGLYLAAEWERRYAWCSSG